MPGWRREVPLPRLWFLTVRLAEVATLALVLGAALELWEAFQASAQTSRDGGDGGGGAAPVPLMRRIVALAFYSGLFRAPLSFVLAAILLAAAVAVLASGQSVRHARLLRWEVLGTWSLAALGVLVLVLLNAVAMFGDNPYESNDPSVISGDAGPGLVEQAVMGLSWPVSAALVLAGVGFWWLRVPADPDAEAAAVADSVVVVADVDEDDLIVLEDVEQIEPVEQLWRGSSPGGEATDGAADGATANGYEDFFRRF